MKTQYANAVTQYENGTSLGGRIIKEGGLVIFPTETVYGLGANGLNSEAVLKIFAAKGRPADNPLILHIAKKSELKPLWSHVPDNARILADTFWPGPLTMIFNRSSIVPDEVTAGLDTVAVRMPLNKTARALINAAGVPTILRPGAVTKEMLEAVIGPVDVAHAVLSPLREGETAASPGMKYRHYAPDAEVVVAEGRERDIAAKICREYDAREAAGEDCIIFATKQTQPFYRGRNCVIIGDRTEPATLCASLFYSLREYGGRADVIFAEALPNDDMGLAYMNRLLRSAGFNII